MEKSNFKNFDSEFIMEMFLDSESVSTTNKLVVAVANVVNENAGNISNFNEVMQNEYEHVSNIYSNSVESVLTGPKLERHCNFDFNFTNEEYVEKLKICKSTVQALIQLLKECYVAEQSIVSIEIKVHVFLWILTNESSYNEVGLIFGLHKSSVNYIFHEMAKLISKLQYQFISWPSVEEQHATRIKVYNNYKIPNCVGFIDTCPLKVGCKRQKKQPEANVVLLQAVCDESLMFIDIYIGEVGKTRKSKVFKDSQLAKKLKNVMEFENHILGDSEFKLQKNLITPYTAEEILTSEEMKFNEVHWKARTYIAQAFELLKEKFSKLNFIDIKKPKAVKMLISSACVLHNFVILHEGTLRMKEEAVTCDEGVTIDTKIVKTAAEKKLFLCNYINYFENSQLLWNQ